MKTSTESEPACPSNGVYFFLLQLAKAGFCYGKQEFPQHLSVNGFHRLCWPTCAADRLPFFSGYSPFFIYLYNSLLWRLNSSIFNFSWVIEETLLFTISLYSTSYNCPLYRFFFLHCMSFFFIIICFCLPTSPWGMFFGRNSIFIFIVPDPAKITLWLRDWTNLFAGRDVVLELWTYGEWKK